MPWYLSDAGLGVLVGLFGVAVAVLLVIRERYDRNRVEVDATRTGVVGEVGGAKPHRVALSLLSTGNRATVVRDIRLVSAEGESYRLYRSSPGRAQPPLPFRVDAPDEKVATLDLTDEDEKRLNDIEVDLLPPK